MSSAVTAPDLTLQNLQAAFNGESNASVRYTAFAKKADEEGFRRVASLFRAAARAEAIHAANHAAVIKKMGGKPEAQIETAMVRSTRENLLVAIAGEEHERDVMYPQFIQQADAVKNAAALRTFQFALEAEAEHARLYAAALRNLEQMTAKTVFYVCAVCGYTVEEKDFAKCPVCNLPEEKFEAID